MNIIKYKNLLRFLFITIIINTSFSADCYVLQGVDETIADGSEQFPYPTIADCRNYIIGEGDIEDTYYIGPGVYASNTLNVRDASVIGSGVNVTTIYSEYNNTCFYDVRNGTIKNIHFGGYEFDGEILACNTGIKVDGSGTEGHVAKIYNNLFSNVTDYFIEVGNPGQNGSVNFKTDIRNNVFAMDNRVIDFNNLRGITFMNNMALANINFLDVSTGGTAEDVKNRFYNNLFLKNCNLPDVGYDQTTYNLVFNFNNWEMNDMNLGILDSNCGELGVNQPSMYFTNFYDLDFVSTTWNLFHIYAFGENSILFDAGHPDWEYNDPDGSRGDIGVMGGLYPWPSGSGPVITDFSVDPIIIPIDGQINVNSKARTE